MRTLSLSIASLTEHYENEIIRDLLLSRLTVQDALDALEEDKNKKEK